MREKAIPVDNHSVRFWCFACSESHTVRVLPVNGSNTVYWNGSYIKPTIRPSIRQLYTSEGSSQSVSKCHCTITNGWITYHGDCLHAFANRRFKLPDYPFNMSGEYLT